MASKEADGIGDLATLLHLIRLGEDRLRPLRPDEIVELIERADPVELWRGCLTLIHGWLMSCSQPEAEDAVVNRLRKLHRFPEETLARIREGLKASVGRETMTEWPSQRQRKPISNTEIAAWLMPSCWSSI